jgi:hypothetical protein
VLCRPETVSADVWQARDQGFIIHGGFGAPMAIPTDAGPRHPEYCGFWQSHKWVLQFIGAPMHAPRFFRKGVEKVWPCSQAD